MSSHSDSRNNGQAIPDKTADELFKSLQETRNKQVANFQTSVVMLEQRYAHFVASLLDVKKRVCMKVFNDQIERISDTCDKQLTVMNQYYQTEIQQLKSEKKQLIRKNHKHQKLIQKYQTQEIQNKKRKRKKHKKHKKCKSKRTNSEQPGIGTEDPDKNIDDGPNDIITNIIMNDQPPIISPFVLNDSDSLSPHSSNTNNHNTPNADDADINFHAMPTFNIDSTPTISKINSTSLTNNNTSNEDTIDSSDNIDIKNDQTNDQKPPLKKARHRKKKKKKYKHKKRRRQRQRMKKEKYKYHYHKTLDGQFYAPPRVGETDKTWLFCNHQRANGAGVCGVKYIRTLKDREDQAQHKCDGDAVQKIITRKLGSIFSKCTYCDITNANVPCTRLANIDEIAVFQEKLKTLNIVPNTYGGYKKRGAKQTISQLSASPKRKARSRSGRRSHSRSRGHKSGKKNARKKLASAGSASPPPRSFMQKDGNVDGVADRAKSLGSGSVLTLPQLSGDDNHDRAGTATAAATVWGDDDATTASDINMENKPLQRQRGRKRKRREFEDDLSSLSDEFVEQELKKQKLDRSQLCKLDLDSLLVKCFHLVLDFARMWDVEGVWCRYCGARGSETFLNSPWGQKKLCQKHGSLWVEKELVLEFVEEAKDRDSVPGRADCTEMEFLVDLVDKYQKMQFKEAPAITIDGKRRSLRNIKKERAVANESESDSDSDGDGEGYIDSSDESEDDDEPISDRIVRKDGGYHNGDNYNHNGHGAGGDVGDDDGDDGDDERCSFNQNHIGNGVNVIHDLNGDFLGLLKTNDNLRLFVNDVDNDNNGNKQLSDQSQDEDDDIFGVD